MADNVLAFAFEARNVEGMREALDGLKDALDRLKKEADQAGKSLDGVGDKGASPARAAGGGIVDTLRETARQAGGLGSVALAIGGITGGLLALNTVARASRAFMKAWVDDVVESEEAALRLGFALQSAGKFSSDAVANFKEFSDGLQRTTKFSADYVTQLAAMVATLGGLSGGTLQRATKAALDFSTATGQSAEQIARLLAGIAATGEARGLDRLKISVDDTLRGAQLLNAVLAEMERRAGGASEAVGTGLAGAFAQVGAAAKDLAGDIARAFDLDDALDNMTRAAIAAINKVDAEAKKLGDAQPVALTQFLQQYISLLNQATVATGAERRKLEEDLIGLEKQLGQEVKLRIDRGDIQQLLADFKAVDEFRKGLDVFEGAETLVAFDFLLERLQKQLDKGLRGRIEFEQTQTDEALKRATKGITVVDAELRLKGTPEVNEALKELKELDRIAKQFREQPGSKRRQIGPEFDIPQLSGSVEEALAPIDRNLAQERKLVIAVTSEIKDAQSLEEVNEILGKLERNFLEAFDAAQKNAAQLNLALGSADVLIKARGLAAKQIEALKQPDIEAKLKLVTDDAEKDLQAFLQAIEKAQRGAGTAEIRILDTEELLGAGTALDQAALSADVLRQSIERMRQTGDVSGLRATMDALDKAIDAGTTGASKLGPELVASLSAARLEARSAIAALEPLQDVQALAIEGRIEIDLGEFRNAELLLLQMRQRLAQDPLNVQVRLQVQQFEDELESAVEKANNEAEDFEDAFNGIGFQAMSRTMDQVLGQMVGSTRVGADRMSQIFDNMVSEIIKSLARLAALKLFKFLLNLNAPGSGGFDPLSGPNLKTGFPEPSPAPPIPKLDPGPIFDPLSLQVTELRDLTLGLTDVVREIPLAASELVEAILMDRERGSSLTANINALDSSDFERYMLDRGARTFGDLARSGRL